VPYKKQDDSALQHRTYFYSMPNFEHTIACTIQSFTPWYVL